MKFKSTRKSRRKSRKGGAPKTMKNNFSNCQNYWSTPEKCTNPWMNLDIDVRPFDIIDYPGLQNKIMGKKPTWLPETSTTGLKRNIIYKNDIQVLEKMAKLNGPMTPYTEVPKEFY